MLETLKEEKKSVKFSVPTTEGIVKFLTLLKACYFD
jgi:hypothetical protein